jgi:hypothetical protein
LRRPVHHQPLYIHTSPRRARKTIVGCWSESLHEPRRLVSKANHACPAAWSIYHYFILFPKYLYQTMACSLPVSVNTDHQDMYTQPTAYFPCKRDMARHLEAVTPLNQSRTATQHKSEAKDTKMAHDMRPMPQTSMEWRVALGEIKREYMNRRFRQCSARCQEILDHRDQFVSFQIHQLLSKPAHVFVAHPWLTLDV